MNESFLGEIMNRRRFLACCAGASAGAFCVAAFGKAETGPHMRFPSMPRERIAVASYPFRDFIASAGEKAAGKMDLKDFAGHVRAKFDIGNIEPWSAHFTSLDRSYLEQLRGAVDKAGSAIVNIAVDGEDSPYASDATERKRAIAFRKQWVDVAAAVGAPSIRTNIPAAKDSQPDLGRLADSLRTVVDYASGKNVVINLENDNPASEDPLFLVKVIDKVNSPWLHALPDFANTLAHFDEQHAYSGIDAMFGRAYNICHVKETEVPENGKPVHVDLARTFGYLKQHHYRGYCSIEWDSPGDPYEGTRKLIETTLRYLS
jgi:sugar phosphate isomerase/epimerase